MISKCIKINEIFMERKSEFAANFKKQVLKLNLFLQTWAKTLKTVTTGEADRHLVIEFSPEKTRVINFLTEFEDQMGF